MGYLTTEKKKVTVKTFVEMKRDGNKIAMLTAYDYTTARLIDGAGVDSILVGDSASNVMLGNDSTLPITLDEMIVYARGVARGCQRRWWSATCRLARIRSHRRKACATPSG